MATNYPGSLDTGTEQPSPLSTTEMDDAGFEHDVVHTNHSGAIIALETKVGVGSSTAVADSVLAGTGAGASGWSTAPSLGGLTVDTDTLHVDATNGRVGIGTTTPNQTLDVDGALAVRNKMVTGKSTFTQEPWSNSTIALGGFGSIGTQGSFRTSLAWNYERGTDSSFYGLGINSYSSAGGIDIGNDGILFRTDATYGATAAPTTRMILTPAGNVGIGTTNPESILHLNPGTNVTPDANGVGHIMIDGSGYTSFLTMDGTGTWIGNNSASRSMILATDETARLTVGGTGLVGIGTTSPADMLDVGNASNYGSFRVHAWKGSESFRVVQNIVRSANIKELTTGSAANVYIATSNSTMYRSTSSIKYKTDVETMEDSYADAILGLRPVWYRSLGPHDPASYGYWGFIAEEVAEVDPRLVNFGVSEDYVYEYDDDGEMVEPDVADLTEPEGVQYDRMVPHLVNLLKRHEARIAALEAA